MLLFGWGTKNKVLQVAEHLAVVRNYAYFHVFFLTVAPLGSSYSLATLTEAGWAQRELSHSDAARLLDGRPLTPSAWDRFSLLVGVLAVVAYALGSSLSQSR